MKNKRRSTQSKIGNPKSKISYRVLTPCVSSETFTRMLMISADLLVVTMVRPISASSKTVTGRAEKPCHKEPDANKLH